MSDNYPSSKDYLKLLQTENPQDQQSIKANVDPLSAIDDSETPLTHPLKYQANRDATRKLHPSIKSQLRSHLSDWAVLNREQAKAFRTGDGIQFYKWHGNGYRKVVSVGPGYGEWVCLVTQGWLNRHNANAAASGGSGAGGSALSSVDDPLAYRQSADYLQPMPTEVVDASQTHHQLALSITNPDGQPMPDARYIIEAAGQTTRGTLDENGEALAEFLPEGEAVVTIEANDAHLSQLHQTIQQQFDGLVNDAAERQRMLDDLLFENGFTEGFLIIGCIWSKAVWDRGVDLGKSTVAMIKGTPDALSAAKQALFEAMQDQDEDGIRDGYAALAQLAGDVKADVERVGAVTLMLMNDETFWSMLMDFVSRFYASLSAEDKAKFFGAASFDVASCFIGAAALAKVATAAKTLSASAATATALTASRYFVPAIEAIKRIAHLHELASTPLRKKITLQQREHALSFRQQPKRDALPDATPTKDIHEPARTDTDKGCESIANTCTSGEPISMVTGEELFEVTDFTVPGPVPLRWQRTYRSTASGTRNAELGYGWSHPWALSLTVDGDTLKLRTDEGATIPFPLPQHGETLRHVSGTQVSRFHDHLTLVHNGQHCLFDADPHHPNRQRLVQWGDASGAHFWRLIYHPESGQLDRATASWGEALAFRYGRVGLCAIDRVTDDSTDTLVRYRLDAQGDLIAAKSPQRPAEQYRYQQHLFAVRQTPTGARYCFEWDQLTPEARCTRQYEVGGTYQYRFDWQYQGADLPDHPHVEFWNKTTDSNGVVEMFGYDANAQLRCHVHGDGGIESFVYDGHQRLVKHTNAEGQTTHNQYDAQHRLVAQTNVAGQTTHIRYWGHRTLPAQITGPNGQTLRFAYDHQDRLIEKTFADGRREHYRYHANGPLAQKIDPLGHVHRYDGHPHWGSLSRYVQYTDQDANEQQTPAQQIDFTYDDQGRLVSQCDHLGNEQHFAYDEQGQLITRSNQHGQSEHFTYDAHGRVIAQTDTAGRTTQFHYGRFAQLEAKTLPDGHQIRFDYDNERNLIALTNPNGAVHRFTYDACERLSSETTVDGRTTDYHYNRIGQLIGLTEGSITARFERDALGQLISEVYDDAERPGAQVHNTFQYTDDGQLKRASNAISEVSFDYTEHGLLAGEHSTHPFIGPYGRQDGYGHSTTLHYNDRQQLIHRKHRGRRPQPDSKLWGVDIGFLNNDPHGHGWTEQFHWHPSGPLAKIDIGVGHEQHTLLTRDLNAHGQITAQTQGHHQLRYGYTDENRLRQMQRHNTNAKAGEQRIQQRDYQYDAAGRLAQIDDQHTGTTTYHYNAQDHLTQHNGQPIHVDANGNRLPSQPDGALDPALDTLFDNRLPFWGDRHYQYDAYGNLITIKRGQNQALVQALTYNAKHQLIELTETHHGQFHQKLIFDYDALGRRIWKKVYQQTPDQERYDRAEETIWHGSQRIQTRYFSDKRRCIHHDITLYEPGSHTPLAMLDNTLGLLDIDTDHLGTPKALYDRKTGDELWSTDHTLYGQTTNNQSHKNHPKTGQPLDPKLRFQGQYEDLETGLYQNLNRYYDPHSGRYINHDPIGLLGGLNQYQYCPNPVEWIDPLGLSPDELIRYKPVESLTAQAGNRGSAINRAWALERQLVIETGQGTRDWSPRELEIIKSTTNSKKLASQMVNEGYTGHHINSVNGNGELGAKWAGDPRNIIFLENANHPNGSTTLNEHLSSNQGHRGDYNNSGNGRLIDRQAMIDQFHASQPKDCP